jgi:hypothetical protein
MWEGVLLYKLVVVKLIKIFLPLLNPKEHVHNSLPLVSVLCRMNPLYLPLSVGYIILPSVCRTPSLCSVEAILSHSGGGELLLRFPGFPFRLL